MVVAMLSTKVALYFGTSPLPLPPAPPQVGAWAVLHEIRSEYAQIMSAIFLLVAGPGPWSVDAILARVRNRGTRTSRGAGSHERRREGHEQAGSLDLGRRLERWT